ncbi:universal stress protein [Anaeromyxobacter sp. PSR-1]|uniref:universal stress protein n=1 Tax=Anaeromyxobacter sp. PSR-1 TaxID=1300915 RepID=UPI000750BFB6|nr:universal stress protein [Anaeromyxobacter sp. PSR-1]
MFGTVLLASDLSSASDSVIGCLQGLRSLGTHRVLLVHALGIRHLDGMRHMLQPFVDPRLRQQLRTLESKGFAVELVIAPGNAPSEISRVAKQNQASMIVIGSHGATLARDALLGGVALGVLHRAEVPVLVVRVRITDEADRQCDVVCQDFRARVLFATDFSDTAERAFTYVEQLVRSGCREVTLLHAQERRPKHREVQGMAEDADRIDRKRLEGMESRLRDLGATIVRIALPYGAPKVEIAQRAEQGFYSLIVMGTQGRGSVGALLLGSVSYHTVHHATVPALLVPPAR